MNGFDEIKERLKKYPLLKVEYTEAFLTVHPQNESGFKVSIYKSPSDFTVYFGDGWHEQFKNNSDALNCFAFGLSRGCRLKVNYRGDFPYQWTVQHQDQGQWKDDSTTGLFFSPFWKPKIEKFFQNSVISD